MKLARIASLLALAFAQAALAETFTAQKCFCVSEAEVGYIMTYTYNETWGVPGLGVVWSRQGLQPRKSADVCPDLCGTECNADRSNCWDVPQLDWCNQGLTFAASPKVPLTTCTDHAGVDYCANDYEFKIGGKRRSFLPQHPKKRRHREKLLSCTAECQRAWPGKGMRSACSHINTNKKSKHYDEAVPCGWGWSGGELKEKSNRSYGGLATCRNDQYEL